VILVLIRCYVTYNICFYVSVEENFRFLVNFIVKVLGANEIILFVIFVLFYLYNKIYLCSCLAKLSKPKTSMINIHVPTIST